MVLPAKSEEWILPIIPTSKPVSAIATVWPVPVKPSPYIGNIHNRSCLLQYHSLILAECTPPTHSMPNINDNKKSRRGVYPYHLLFLPNSPLLDASTSPPKVLLGKQLISTFSFWKVLTVIVIVPVALLIFSDNCGGKSYK